VIGQCRLCGELITPVGGVLYAPDPRLASFALLSVTMFFHLLQRHPNEAEGAINLCMRAISQYAAALCVSTAEPDHEALQAGMKAELYRLVEDLRYDALSKSLVLGLSATEAGGGNSTNARTT